MNIEKIIQEKKEIVDKAIEQILLPYKDHNELGLHNILHYNLLPEGKRLRPILTILIFQIFDQDIEKIIKCACAIELLHVATLILDDLPCMDNDDYRRGKLSSHKKFGQADSILVSVGLSFDAFKIFSSEAKRLKLPASVALDLIRDVADKMGLWGLLCGQIADLNLGKNLVNLKSDEAKLGYMVYNKTAALFELCALVAAHVAQVPEKTKNALADYAKNFGYAFQIYDDLKDLEDDQQLTFPKVYGVDGSKKKFFDSFDKANKSIDFLGSKAENLKELTAFLKENFSKIKL